VGLDVPGWLLALEHEVEQERRARSYLARADAWRLPLAQVPMTFDEVQQQLSGWEPKPAGGASDTPAPEGA